MDLGCCWSLASWLDFPGGPRPDFLMCLSNDDLLSAEPGFTTNLVMFRCCGLVGEDTACAFITFAPCFSSLLELPHACCSLTISFGLLIVHRPNFLSHRLHDSHGPGYSVKTWIPVVFAAPQNLHVFHSEVFKYIWQQYLRGYSPSFGPFEPEIYSSYCLHTACSAVQTKNTLIHFRDRFSSTQQKY